MIYSTDPGNHIEQGDICYNLPKITPDLFFIGETGSTDAWDQYASSLRAKDKQITFLARPIPTVGVALSQTCDIRPGEFILFAELISTKLKESPKERVKEIKRIIRDKTRFHYFPPDSSVQLLKEPHILNFKSLFIVPYDIILNNILSFFVARLILDAREVLRDKINRFFTRLAFEDIMFLLPDEIRSQIRPGGITENEVSEILRKVGRDFP